MRNSSPSARPRAGRLSTCVITVVDEEGERVALVKGAAYIKGTALGE
ncbi:MAG: hypothetical protein HY821_08185 [Acidobacteria bacterium]|nr:hypothetical protein [Acidobacteriota bacterium]